MSRTESYVVAIVTLILSLYGREILRLLRRGWIRGRLNSLTSTLTTVEAMHSDLRSLIIFIAFAVLRAVFLVSLMLVVQNEQRERAYVPVVFGYLCGDLLGVAIKLTHVRVFESYAPRARAKIEKLTGLLEERKGPDSEA